MLNFWAVSARVHIYITCIYVSQKPLNNKCITVVHSAPGHFITAVHLAAESDIVCECCQIWQWFLVGGIKFAWASQSLVYALKEAQLTCCPMWNGLWSQVGRLTYCTGPAREATDSDTPRQPGNGFVVVEIKLAWAWAWAWAWALMYDIATPFMTPYASWVTLTLLWLLQLEHYRNTGQHMILVLSRMGVLICIHTYIHTYIYIYIYIHRITLSTPVCMVWPLIQHWNYTYNSHFSLSRLCCLSLIEYCIALDLYVREHSDTRCIMWSKIVHI